MPERISDVIREERGNDGAIRVLSVLSALASATSSTTADSSIKTAASLVSGTLNVVAKALAGELEPDQINLDELFVKSPTELLKERGINEEEIERIIRGDQ